MNFNMFQVSGAEFPEGLSNNFGTTYPFIGDDGSSQTAQLLPGVLMAVMNSEGGINRIGVTTVKEDVDTATATTQLRPDNGKPRIAKLVLRKKTSNDIKGELYLATDDGKGVTSYFTPNVADLESMAALYAVYTAMQRNEPAYKTLADYVKSHDLKTDGMSDEATRGWAILSKEIKDRCVAGQWPMVTGSFKKLPKELRYTPEETAATQAVTVIDDGKYKLKGYTCPPEMTRYLKKMPSWYIVPEAARHIAILLHNPKLRDFMMWGGAGAGKSSICDCLGELTGLPKLEQVFSENTDESSTWGGYIPDVVGMKQEKPVAEILEGFSDDDFLLSTDKVAVALGLKPDATMKEIMAFVATAGNGSSGGQTYHYEESPIVKVLRFGGICELQEVKSVRKPGVLVTLNHLMDGSLVDVTLPTGEVVRRNPYAVFIMTTNNDYVGCRDMNQSVLSRNSQVFHIELPNEAETKARCKKATDFSDDALLDRMVKTIFEIREYLAANDINSGVCGQRELNAWAEACMTMVQFDKSIMLDETLVKQEGEYAVMQKVSQSEEEIEQVRTAKWDLLW